MKLLMAISLILIVSCFSEPSERSGKSCFLDVIEFYVGYRLALESGSDMSEFYNIEFLINEFYDNKNSTPVIDRVARYMVGVGDRNLNLKNISRAYVRCSKTSKAQQLILYGENNSRDIAGGYLFISLKDYRVVGASVSEELDSIDDLSGYQKFDFTRNSEGDFLLSGEKIQ
ncbi:hypothetical protein [Pleionea sp. CnH1-48]|uniref:hypothetical protein n=1 Tax=Pleionea sp. CnH1-48 TaxID=2954494 RepID=UPI00209849E1|nr:hypothetical protein [Pleionea sp. CnH1-48]MCO7225787.1 hypothetical protein [Pleionea sp. CnH1-48]